MSKKVTKEQIRVALMACGGVISTAAEKLKVSRSSINARVMVDQDLLDAREEAKQELLDASESNLFKAARRGDPWAIRFVLGRLGRGRGYGPSLDVGGTAPGRVVVYLPDDGREQPEQPEGTSDQSSGVGDTPPAGPASNCPTE